MRVFIIRHGETKANLSNIFGTDSPLTDLGKEQAQRIANRLRLEKIDIIFCSPLIRALNTGKIIAQYHPNTPFIIEPLIKEIFFGTWEGRTWEEITNIFGRKAYTLSPHEEFVDRVHEGESLEQRVGKLIPLIDDWKNKYKNKTILLSTHGYALKAILVAFKVTEYNESLQMTKFGNTALTIIKPFDEEKIELLADIRHLED